MIAATVVVDIPVLPFKIVVLILYAMGCNATLFAMWGYSYYVVSVATSSLARLHFNPIFFFLLRSRLRKTGEHSTKSS